MRINFPISFPLMFGRCWIIIHTIKEFCREEPYFQSGKNRTEAREEQCHEAGKMYDRLRWVSEGPHLLPSFNMVILLYRFLLVF